MTTGKPVTRWFLLVPQRDPDRDQVMDRGPEETGGAAVMKEDGGD